MSVRTANVLQFLKQFAVKKKVPANDPRAASASAPAAVSPSAVITNTRIGSTSQEPAIFGGAYSIPNDEDYHALLQKIYKHVVCESNMEYLTETQLPESGPLLVDIDFRYPFHGGDGGDGDGGGDNDEDGDPVHHPQNAVRQYTTQNIINIVFLYAQELFRIYEFASDTAFPVFVMEKARVNCIPEKKIVKDGIHIVFGIHVPYHIQLRIREFVIREIQCDREWKKLVLANSVEEIFDMGISTGKTNWQVYGCRKPHHDRYELTMKFSISIHPDDDELYAPHEIFANHLDYVTSSTISELSVRANSPSHIRLPLRKKYQLQYQAPPEKHSSSASSAASSSASASSSMRQSSSSSSSFDSASASAQHDAEMIRDLNRRIGEIRTETDMHEILAYFIDQLPPDKMHFKDVVDYTMILSRDYYDDYQKWLRVGWALCNTSQSLLIVWIVFSSKSTSKFNIRDIYDNLVKRWEGFMTDMNPGGLTERSIMHWAKECDGEKYKEIRKKSVHLLINHTIQLVTIDNSMQNETTGDYDIACVLHKLFKDSFVCTSVKSHIWYQFQNHRWHQNDSGTSLRKAISEELRKEYFEYYTQINIQLARCDADSPDCAKLKKKREKVNNIISRLSKTKDKQNIMVEARELFYDKDFMTNLDMNTNLIGFNNGVFDFTTASFRDGFPEDYISKSTNIDYIKTEEVLPAIRQQIETFMHQLFPDQELYDYMMQHLASTMLGKTIEQTFNVYVGIGQNGKSVLILLMEKVLGEYKADVPLSLIIEKRTKLGSVTPEIAALRGIRYAVMQEPSKGDKIHEGQLKALTGGDNLQGRQLFMDMITFKPQFKLVVCTNELFEMESNCHGTWRRIRLVQFKALFTENPNPSEEHPFQFQLDKHIHEKFDEWATSFASMLVDIACRTKGTVTTPEMVLQASNEYRKQQDYLLEYIMERIERFRDATITKEDLNINFQDWYKINNSTKAPKSFKKDLQASLEKFTGAKMTNNVWRNIRFKPPAAAAAVEPAAGGDV